MAIQLLLAFKIASLIFIPSANSSTVILAGLVPLALLPSFQILTTVTLVTTGM